MFVKNKLKYLIYTAFLILLCPFAILSQVRHAPIEDYAYELLNKASTKGIIEFNNLIRPLSGIYITSKLIELENKKEQLNPLEYNELQRLFDKYYVEKNLLDDGELYRDAAIVSSYSGKDISAVIYADKNTQLRLDPISGFELASKNENSITHFWMGARGYIYYKENIAVNLFFALHTENGSSLDADRNFTPERGTNLTVYDTDQLQYNFFNASVSYSWDSGYILFGKEPIEWGFAENGLLVHSQKALSYPQIKLNIEFSDWLTFNYNHGWLNSYILDSTHTYPTLLEDKERKVYIGKYLVSHTLQMRFSENILISIGESMVYSDKLQPGYFIPVIPFRLVDHYLVSDDDNDAGSNAQIFANFSLKNLLKNSHIFGTFFLDEMSIGALFDENTSRNQMGITLGAKLYDYLIDNLTITAEYTRINPFVYNHYIPTIDYRTSDHIIGHWMGSNGDLLYGSLKYRFLKGLEFKIWSRLIRKGTDDEPSQFYTKPQPKFLYGDRKDYLASGININYEVIQNLYLNTKLEYNKVSADSDYNYTDYSFAIYYGL